MPRTPCTEATERERTTVNCHPRGHGRRRKARGALEQDRQVATVSTVGVAGSGDWFECQERQDKTRQDSYRSAHRRKPKAPGGCTEKT